ncbi:MAG: aminomethyltransferase [Cyclobacteriaceae bacterium]|nr:MAG: aminomethyltransferase [Cyclobacteriaceae bacterium]
MSVKQIPLHPLHVKLGAKIIPFAGFEMPVRYTSDIEEHLTVRNGVGVFDVSHMGEFIVQGKGALDLIQYVTTNDASRLSIGQAQYSCMPNETGGIVDDLLVYRLEENKYMLVVNASNIEKDWNWINRFNTFGAHLFNASGETCLFAVQGPRAAEVLQKITSLKLNEIPYYHFKIGTLAGIPDIIISNTGYTGAGGFELYVHRSEAEKLWHAVFEAGAPFAIKPIGLGARDTLRLEMGFCLYGNDIDDTTSPLEAGLGWITRFTKDFVNSQALKKQKEEGVKRKLTGFIMKDRGIPRHNYPILDTHGNPAGIVTSGTQSPVLQTGIGMGYVPEALSAPGTEILIDIRGKHVPAVVHKPPFIETK